MGLGRKMQKKAEERERNQVERGEAVESCYAAADSCEWPNQDLKLDA